MRVKHLLEVGWLVNIHGTNCDLKFESAFVKCSIVGVFPDVLYSDEVNRCEYLRLTEATRCARAFAEQLELQKKQQERDRQAELNQLKRFALSSDIASEMNELLQLLCKQNSDSKWQDSIDDFWKMRTPIVGCEPLIRIAPAWWKQWFWRIVRYAPLSLQERIKVLSQPALQLDQILRMELVQEIVNEGIHAMSLRELFKDASLRLRFELLLALPSDGLPPLEDLAVQAFLEAAEGNSKVLQPHFIEEFWAKYGNTISKQSPLFPIAPKHIQRAILRKHFHRHLELIATLFSHHPSGGGDWAASDVYGALTAEDERLAAWWSSGSERGYDPSRTLSAHEAEEFAKMLAARAAEKVASWFYQNLDFQTTDIAIHQLTGQSTEWTTHDLVLNGTIHVDVKNARLPVHSKTFYVEHTVKRFKKDRRDQKVTIAGVVSPYLTLLDLRRPEALSDKECDVQFLGETNLEAITRTCRAFTKYALTVNEPSAGAFLPPWYFDFPDAWYREFDENCATLRQSELPDVFETQILYGDQEDAFPLPQYMAARLPVTNCLANSMAPWMCDMVTELQEICTPRAKVSHLFLLLLTDFLKRIRLPPDSSFEPSSYSKLLYQATSSGRGFAGRRPLGIEDPLGTIQTLISSLQQLWTERQHLNLERFTEYRLSGGGILQGRERQGNPWETVLAYCGGRIEGKGKCGCSPLILGREQQCPVCRKLICNECDYCSKKCVRVSGSTSHKPRTSPSTTTTRSNCVNTSPTTSKDTEPEDWLSEVKRNWLKYGPLPGTMEVAEPIQRQPPQPRPPNAGKA